MDKARAKTDKQLDNMEKDISRVYKKSPALLSVQKEYAKYMAMVTKRTKELYEAYTKEEDKDIKAEKKKAYMDKVRELTLNSAEYKKLTKKITDAITQTNKQALAIANDAMQEVYVENYNQVAEECERVGIKVDGKE